jgi:hypothetical protein
MDNKEKRIIEYKNSIVQNLESITDQLSRYQAVDATLSEDTLMRVNAYLMAADRTLEKGFVIDACNEIEEQLSKIN